MEGDTAPTHTSQTHRAIRHTAAGWLCRAGWREEPCTAFFQGSCLSKSIEFFMKLETEISDNIVEKYESSK